MAELTKKEKEVIDFILRRQAKMCANMGVSDSKHSKQCHKEKLRLLDDVIEFIDPEYFPTDAES